MKKRSIILLLLLLIIWNPLLSQTTSEKIDQLMQSYSDIKKFNGNVLVTKNGNILFSKSYGMADFEWKMPNSAQTKFRIGSNSKFFTSVAVFQLVEKGKINLDKTISDYLPWFDKELGSKITVRQMLAHTSGLKNYTERADFYDVLAHLEITPEQFAKQYLQDKELLFQPGTKYNYCNTDYYLLGLIIGTVAQKPYEQYIKENIFDKVGMKNSGIDTPSEILDQRARGYEYDFNGYKNARPINMYTSTYSAGALYSTSADMELWMQAMDRNALISEASKKLIYTPGMTTHGLGVFIGKMNNGLVVVRPGAINGFSALTSNFIDDKIHIILLDNSSANRRGNHFEDIAGTIYQIVNNKTYELPKIPVSYKMGEVYKLSGILPAIDFYKKIKADSQYNITQSASELNSFGYSLLKSGKNKDALKIFELATKEFPTLANAFDSYAEALTEDGQKQEAIRNYERVLELSPGDNNATKQLKILKGN